MRRKGGGGLKWCGGEERAGSGGEGWREVGQEAGPHLPQAKPEKGK